MRVTIEKESFSQASCVMAMALAARAINERLGTDPNIRNPDALTKEELELLAKVREAFAAKKSGD